MASIIHVTEKACAYIKSILEKNNRMGLRLSIKKTGCTGYAYCPTLIDEVNPADTMLEPMNGVKIFIDTNWFHLLQGLQVDYVEDTKSGLKQKRLVYINPNEGGRCGCGESFHLEKDKPDAKGNERVS